MATTPAYQQCRAIAYNPHMNHVAVSNNYGDIHIFNYDDFSFILALQQPDEWNEVIKYSPNGNYMAVGSHDNCIYVYRCGVLNG